MKKVLFLLFILLSSIQAYGQENVSKKDAKVPVYTESGEMKAITPEELQNWQQEAFRKRNLLAKHNLTSGERSSGLLMNDASKYFLFSMGSGVIGATGIVLGTSVIKGDAKWAGVAIGGLFGILSITYGIKGYITIGKAGKQLDIEQNRIDAIYLKPSTEGVGINLSF